MEKIYLSDAGPKVSPAIYGFYRWNEEKDVTSQTMDKIINKCLDLGINTFDHADFYGSYQCEELFGRAIRSATVKREDIVLFTKCGSVTPHSSLPDIRVKEYNSSSEHIRKSVDKSLKNLQTDYIDIFLLDHLDPLSNLEETALTLKELKSSGKIKNIGVANFTVFEHQLLSSYLKEPIVTNHIELNLLNLSALENGRLDYIKQRYMRPLASSPLAAGRIAIGTDRKAVEVREKLTEIAEKYGVDIESIAVAWLVALGALPLVGTVNLKRIENIANAFNIELDRQDWYDLYWTSKEQA